MRLLLAGASGLIGRALASAYSADGDDVRLLVRRPPSSANEVKWDPATGELDPAVVEGIDAVVCLSGVGVAEKRWSDSFRAQIKASRTDSVGTLAKAIAASTDRPAVFVSASAIGYYGDTGTQPVDESTPSGSGFFPDVCRDWEAAAAPAAAAGVRTVQLRTGLVLARRGPVLARMVPLVRLGVGGRLGSGEQYWSWISLTDEIAAIRFALEHDDVSGPVNLTAPNPVTNTEFTRILAGQLHRPAILPVPEFALKIVLDGFATEILTGQRVLPKQLLDHGFEFQFPELPGALAAELAK